MDEERENLEEDCLPISAVAEFRYCPRNFYYRFVEGAEDHNAFLTRGRLAEERRRDREEKPLPDGRQHRFVYLSSAALGLTGVVDVVEEVGDTVYPVEYKSGRLRENPWDEVQLCAQAMLLEEALGRDIAFGYLYYGESHTRRQVWCTEELRETVRQAAKEARAVVKEGTVPAPLDDERCHGCSLVTRCLPAEVRYLTGGGEAPSRVVPGLNLGRVLYLDEPGAQVGKRGGHLVVTKDKAVLREVPACDVDQVVIAGAAGISTFALRMLLDREVDVCLLSGSGRYQGRLSPPGSKHGDLRVEQVCRHLDPAFSLDLGRRLVGGKLRNCRTLLLRHRRSQEEPVAAAVEGLRRLLPLVEAACDPQQLLGLEGQAARLYFEGLARLFRPGLPFAFERRMRRPPKDPINSLLSFAYSLLAKDVLAAIHVAGLDPYVGFYHRQRYARPALALDLMEEFRPVIADSVVLRMVNTGLVQAGDFEERFGGCYLSDSARKAFYHAYETRCAEEVQHPVFSYRLSYRRILELQARFLAKVLLGDLPEYRAFTVR
ncbi:MAG: CRISPR-associated endonuclease Cas1 [Thermaerobacter sp.]|nr:CRISPR-associated endonuclease Cas1 [Thermaerobacter sp.]